MKEDEQRVYDLLIRQAREQVRSIIPTADVRPIAKCMQKESASPDFLVEVRFSLVLMGAELAFKLPILIEVESAASIDGALRDLRVFEERSLNGQEKFRIELPFLVVSDGRPQKALTVDAKLPVRFKMIDTVSP